MPKLFAAVLAAGLALALALAQVQTSRAAAPQVAGLQVALRAWGVYGGPIDAVAGPGTRAAVRAFQERAGLPADGVAGAKTRRALGPLGRPLLGRRTIRVGAFGWDVSVLQFELTRAGLYRWPVDGFFGPETADALKRLQKRHGLVADGVAGPRTLALVRHAAPAVRAAPQEVALSTYVVQPGDTLTALAARFHTSLPALARANKMGVNDVLVIGRKLRTPASAAVAASPGEVRSLVDTWADRFGVDPALARAVAWMESGYQTNLVSDAGAWGVMQLIPSAWDYVETVLLGQDVPRTVEGNVRVGCALLRQLLQEFGGDERLALGAWYQGPRAVREHGLYPETKTFVANVLALRTRV
jgi:peptidoglycan hydrolase-like protein with peptidoglycan-binding domain